MHLLGTLHCMLLNMPANEDTINNQCQPIILLLMSHNVFVLLYYRIAGNFRYFRGQADLNEILT